MAIRTYLISGSPVSQARILTIFNSIFEQLGINALCVPGPSSRMLNAAAVNAAFWNRSVCGLIMTRPHPVDQLPHFNDW